MFSVGLFILQGLGPCWPRLYLIYPGINKTQKPPCLKPQPKSPTQTSNRQTSNLNTNLPNIQTSHHVEHPPPPYQRHPRRRRARQRRLGILHQSPMPPHPIHRARRRAPNRHHRAIHEHRRPLRHPLAHGYKLHFCRAAGALFGGDHQQVREDQDDQV